MVSDFGTPDGRRRSQVHVRSSSARTGPRWSRSHTPSVRAPSSPHRARTDGPRPRRSPPTAWSSPLGVTPEALFEAVPSIDAVLARKMWRTLEPLHGMVYFAPEAPEEYARARVRGASRRLLRHPRRADGRGRGRGRDRHLLQLPSRARAPPHPQGLGRRAARRASSTRGFRLAGAALERVLGADGRQRRRWPRRRPSPATPPRGLPARGAPALRRARRRCRGPTEPHLVLWHAITLLREYRGDGHIAVAHVRGRRAPARRS